MIWPAQDIWLRLKSEAALISFWPVIKNGECLLQSTSEVNNLESNIVEFISATSYEVILKLSSTIEATLKSENNLYTISCSKNITTKQLLKAMIEADIDILYYRDITNSTKRLF